MHHGTRRLLIAGLIMFVPPVLFASSALAQEAEDPAGEEIVDNVDRLTIDDIEPGDCFPAVTLPGRSVECRFPLSTPGLVADRFELPIVADLDVSFDDENPATCRVEVHELVCEAVEAFYRFGTSEVGIRFGFGETSQLASFEVRDPFDYAIDASVVGREPIVTQGRPLVLNVRPLSSENQPAAWVMVRDRSRRELIEAVPVAQNGTTTWPDTIIEAPSAPGRYTAELCIGEETGSCESVPGVFSFQVIEPELRELIEGHNRVKASRINLVFAGSGFPDSAKLVEVAVGLLSLDGPVPIDVDGRAVGTTAEEVDPEQVFDLAWGPFAIEPLRSSKKLFNFWYIEDDIRDVRALFHNAHPEFARQDELAGFDLDHVSIISIDYETDGRYGRSEANWTSFLLSEDVPRVNDVEFAGIYLWVDGFWPYGAADTLTHELGHALFDLRDEYSENTRDVQFGYPNCAEGLEQAFEWWGDDVGSVDPFVHTYIETQQRFGLWVPPDLVEKITIGFELGGCYGGGEEVVRPSSDSIMNSETPVFGTVNRRRVEDLLDLFDGRAPLTDYDELTVGCLPGSVAVPGRVVRCSGSLAEGIDAPAAGLGILVGGRMGQCNAAEPDDLGVRSVSCDGVELRGEGPWTVSVSIDGELASFLTRIDNPLAGVPRFAGVTAEVDGSTESTELQTDTTEGTVSAVTGDGSTSVPWSIAAALFAAFFIAVGGYLWSRAGRKGRSVKDDHEGSSPD